MSHLPQEFHSFPSKVTPKNSIECTTEKKKIHSFTRRRTAENTSWQRIATNSQEDRKQRQGNGKEEGATRCLLKRDMMVRLSEPLRGSRYGQRGALVERTRGSDKNRGLGQKSACKMTETTGSLLTPAQPKPLSSLKKMK